MIRRPQRFQPKEGQRRENATLVGDRRRQHPVEGADAVGRHDDKTVAEVVNVPDLAAATGEAGNLTFQQRRHETFILIRETRRPCLSGVGKQRRIYQGEESRG